MSGAARYGPPESGKRFRLKPRRSETSKPSKDPSFAGAGRPAPRPAMRRRRASTGKAKRRLSTMRNRRWRPGQAERRRQAQRHDLAVAARRCRQGDRQMFPPPQRGIPQVPRLPFPPTWTTARPARRKPPARRTPGASAAPRPAAKVERFFGLSTEKQPRRLPTLLQALLPTLKERRVQKRPHVLRISLFRQLPEPRFHLGRPSPSNLMLRLTIRPSTSRAARTGHPTRTHSISPEQRAIYGGRRRAAAALASAKKPAASVRNLASGRPLESEPHCGTLRASSRKQSAR